MPVTHHYTQYVLKEPKPHNPYSGSALLRKELGGDKPHILEHKKAPWSKQSRLLKNGLPDSQTRLIDVQSYASHLRLACSYRMAAGHSDDARKEQRGEGEA